MGAAGKAGRNGGGGRDAGIPVRAAASGNAGSPEAAIAEGRAGGLAKRSSDRAATGHDHRHAAGSANGSAVRLLDRLAGRQASGSTAAPRGLPIAAVPLLGAGLSVAALSAAVLLARADAIVYALAAATVFGIIVGAVPLLTRRHAGRIASSDPAPDPAATARAWIEAARDEAFRLADVPPVTPTPRADEAPSPAASGPLVPDTVADREDQSSALARSSLDPAGHAEDMPTPASAVPAGQAILLPPAHPGGHDPAAPALLPPSLADDVVADDLVIQRDLSGTVVSANFRVAAALGVAPEAIVGRRFRDIAAKLAGFPDGTAPADRTAPTSSPLTDPTDATPPWATLGRAFPGADRGPDGDHLAPPGDPADSADTNPPPLLGDLPVGSPDARRWFAFSETAITRNGEVAGWLTVGRDVTDRKVTEDALKVARQRAETANAAKSRFLAMVSHEIRTPLNGILGMTGLLMQTPLTPEQRTYARAVETSGEALLLLIEDLLDFSKIEAGRLDLIPRPTLLAEIIEELVELLAPRATTKGIELASYVDPRLPPEFEIDPIRLKQVLFNLAGNGIKFTSVGGVAVEVWDAGEVDDAGRRPVLFQVRDTGIGIGAADTERIFREFEQADPGPARSYGGTGLGLAIARQLVLLMGGDISVESRPGAGACFSFTVPLAPAGLGSTRTGSDPTAPPTPAAPAARAAQLTGARAAQERLFAIFGSGRRPVEDPAALARPGEHPLAGRRIVLLSHALIEAPFILRRLFDAGADVTLLTQRELERGLADGPVPDVILVDAAVGDPVWIIDRVRAITGVPACILVDPRQRPLLPDLQAVGYGAYLVKPVRARSLIAAITMLTRDVSFDDALADFDDSLDAAARGTDGGDPAPVGTGLRVLLCDDNEINLLLGRGLLEKLGAAVTVAEDGRHAVRAAVAGFGAPSGGYDLVLMDLHMPEMDGIEAARLIRDRLGDRAPSIAALTADIRPDTRGNIEPELFDAWLAKPLMPEDLRDLLETVAARRGDRSGS